jgi:curved DNA-binding protein
MPEEKKGLDYYDVLQVSSNAEPETINRVFRLLAQRFHPDNQTTGNEDRFRVILEAYNVLSNPEKRAQYDIVHEQQRKDRWRLVATGAQVENDFEMEQLARLSVLEILYTKRRLEQNQASIYLMDLEKLIGRPREHLEFTIWYLVQKRFIQYDDNSRLILTVEGAEYLEQSYRTNSQLKRLPAPSEK